MWTVAFVIVTIPKSIEWQLNFFTRSTFYVYGINTHLASQSEIDSISQDDHTYDKCKTKCFVWDLQYLFLTGSRAAIKLEGVVTKASLLKDVKQLSPQHQTFSLEAFHSLIFLLAPKHTGFSYLGMGQCCTITCHIIISCTTA